MSTGNKVQSYLNRHKISNLFENMMAKLVKDMPAEPLDYLTHLIQDKKEKSKRSSPPGGFDSGTDHSTSVWTADSRDYEKPWKMKKSPQKAAEGVMKKDWDHTVRLTNKSFDDLSPPSKPKHPSGSKKFRGDLFDSTPKGNVDCYLTEEQLLAEELLSPSSRSKEDNSSTQNSDSVKHHPKHKGPKADAARHEKELKAFLDEKKAQIAKSDSGVSSAASDDEMTDGRVLAEDADDLAAEGIKTSSSNSAQVRKPASAPADSMIQLSICSRCAKVVTNDGDNASIASSSSASTMRSSKVIKPKKAQSNVSAQWATHRTDSKASPQQNPTMKSRAVKSSAPKDAVASVKSGQPMGKESVGYEELVATHRTGFSSYYDDDDDEFESVSQISGDKARIPMWTNSDDEELSPVKGSHMLTSPRHTKPGSQQKTVTLKEDMLKTVPRAGNQVEQFIGASRTWSGERADEQKNPSRRSYESFSSSRRGREQPAPHKSYDAFASKNTANWRFETNSDDSEY